MEYFDFNRFLSVQIKIILVYKKYIFCEEMSSVLTPWLPIYPCVHAIRCPFLYIFHTEKNLNIFATNRCNKMCVCVRLLEWLHWWHTFLCNLLEKHYVTFIISWHCSLGGNFLADTIRYLSWPALSRSQATGLDAWASRVKCPARFVSHLHDIWVYMSCL